MEDNETDSTGKQRTEVGVGAVGPGSPETEKREAAKSSSHSIFTESSELNHFKTN